MKEDKKVKNNKRTLIILVLAIIALICVTGYGVWSRYYTDGNFEATETVSISSFNPTADSSFIYDAAQSTRTATIQEYAGGYYVYDTIEIKNDGETTVEINIDNINATTSGSSYCLYSVSAEQIGMDGTGYETTGSSYGNVMYKLDGSDNTIPFTLAAGESKTVEIGVAVGADGSSLTNVNSDTLVYTTSAIYGGDTDVSINYTITATQQ